MIEWLRERPLSTRVLIYAVAAVLAFAVAASVGAMTALMLQNDPSAPSQEEPAGEQGGAPEGGGGADRARQEEAGGGGGQEEGASPQQDPPQQQEEGVAEGDAEGVAEGDAEGVAEGDARLGDARLGEEEYEGRVGAIQGEAVGIFEESHEKLVLYDALTARDVDEMRANEAALEGLAREAEDLAPPRGREEHHEVFASAVAGLREASGEAYELANDPVRAAEVGFDGYDARVEAVAGLLERSNGMLGRDHETIGDPREISPQLGATEPARRSQDAART